MSKTKILKDQFVRIEAKDSFWTRDSDEETRTKLDVIVAEAKRHVDNIADARVVVIYQDVCSECGSRWGEKSDAYNGGCCDEDEKNNPEAANASNNP